MSFGFGLWASFFISWLDRYRHSAVLSGNSMFTFGGVDKAQNRFADLFEFDMVERTWSEVMTTGEPPTPRTFHKSVVHDGHMSEKPRCLHFRSRASVAKRPESSLCDLYEL